MSEQDPPSVAAKRAKLRWTIIPWEPLSAAVRVFDFGAKKHSPRGWETVPDAIEVYKDAAARHFDKIMLGEVLDPDTGEPHAVHLACCALVIAWHQMRPKP